MSYTKKDLFTIIQRFVDTRGTLPNRRTIREMGISDSPFYRQFNSFSKAVEEFVDQETTNVKLEAIDAIVNSLTDVTYINAIKNTMRSGNATSPCLYDTTLVIPDAHVGPDQDLTRFDCLNALITERKPTNIIFMGDFVTLESLSNWDLSKSGIMEGRRYQQDIAAGKEALARTLKGVGTGHYKPTVIYLHGNHELRLERYIETKPELAGQLDLNTDLDLKGFGVHHIIPYRESYEIEGTLFMHSPMNAANQGVSGKYAIHRAAEMMSKSLVFAHTHRKESVNYYRHGADDIIQIFVCGAFFEHTDSYAYSGLNSYWRGCSMLTHWKESRFDVEDIAMERLRALYP